MVECDAAPTCANNPNASAMGAAEWAASAGSSGEAYAPFVTILDTQSDRVIELACVTSRDVVCDLGFGDAQFLLHVAAATGCRCIGCEVKPACEAGVQASRRGAPHPRRPRAAGSPGSWLRLALGGR